MFVIAGILTAAMTLQYVNGELPCPLCLLERVAMLGVCFGIMLNFRRGFSYQNTGFSLLFAIVLLVVSVRQSLLDIYPRPGHEYIGSAIFGIHMPVWSIIIALALLIAYAIKLAILGGDEYLREADGSRVSRNQEARIRTEHLHHSDLRGEPSLGDTAMRPRRVSYLQLQTAAVGSKACARQFHSRQALFRQRRTARSYCLR